MKFLIFFIAFFCTQLLSAQFYTEKKEIKDTAFTVPMITASYAVQFTASDMADRFGWNNNIGGSFAVKTKKGWYYGFKGNFLWGADVKEKGLLKALETSEGLVINTDGTPTKVFLDQRGSSFFVTGGRLFNVFAPNKNSGILVYGGLGMLQHKISIKFSDEIRSLTDEHKKGYDRFSVGFAVNAFAGYLFLSKNRLLNFFGGIDVTQGWTESLRKFNFDTGLPDNEVHSDFLYGIRIGWIIRLNKRTQGEFYYN